MSTQRSFQVTKSNAVVNYVAHYNGKHCFVGIANTTFPPPPSKGSHLTVINFAAVQVVQSEFRPYSHRREGVARVTITFGRKNRDLSERRACGYNAQAGKTQIPSAIGDQSGDCSQSWGCRGKTPDEIQIRETTCSCFLSSPTKSAHLRPVGVGRIVNRTDLRLVGRLFVKRLGLDDAKRPCKFCSIGNVGR